VVDYGSFPDQKRSYFSLVDAKATLQKLYPRDGQEGQIYKGLESLTSTLFAREFVREDGTPLRIERMLIDCNWGTQTETVYQFCRQSPFASSIFPSRGRYVGAGSMPWDQFKVKPGERLGHHWMIPSVSGKRAIRHVEIDVNYWKSFAHARLRTSHGDKGAWSLFGKAEDHRMLGEHLTAEYRVRTEGRGRKVDEWKLKPGRPDNHFLDCLVGAAVAASMQGVQITQAAAKPSTPKPQVQQRRRVTYL
jgi:phage terminase large subunit GpA-like protein